MGEIADYYRDQAEDWWEDGIDDHVRAAELFAQDIWLTRDGREIPLKKMTSGHLRAAIGFISRGGSPYGLGREWLPKLEGEWERRILEED